MDALIKSKAGDNDIVFREALDIVSDLSETETTALLYILWLHLYQERPAVSSTDINQSPFIQRTYAWIADVVFEQNPDGWQESRVGYDIESQVARDLQFLEASFIERNAAGDFELPLERVKPLTVLMMDGDIRYDYSGDELLEYLLAMLKGLHEP